MKPYTSSDFSRWNEEQNFIDMRVQAMLTASHHTRYIHEQTPAENRIEQLNDIERSNVETSQRNYQHEE